MKAFCSKRWVLLGAIIALPVLGPGCSDDDDDGGTPAGEVYTDAEITQVMRTANEGEIQHAQAALQRAVDPEVRAYAERMIAEHGQAQDDLDQLIDDHDIEPQESAVSRCLEMEASGLLETIQPLPDDAFDVGYIAAQVVLHEDVLNAMDEQLIPRAQDADVRAYLTDLRPIIDDHLQDAEALLDRFGEEED
ncbi:MAG: DUF4142 domain-containing protein [Polyangiaceae bacterium]|nr:DUF4142 domain-containing protein [Polyangiaceae bacterium]